MGAFDLVMSEEKARLGEIKSQVHYILHHYPDTRSNDGLLVVRWLEVFKGVDSHQGLIRLAMSNSLSFESVRRERQKIQREGLFLPLDKEVLRKRKLLSAVHSELRGADL